MNKVTELAKKLHLPEEIINKPPSAELEFDQTDETELGASYEEIDPILIAIENNQPLEKFNQDLVNNIQKRIKQNKHKSKMPPILDYK